MIRDYLQEGDLVSAEVQHVNSDGSLSLHTRSQKYGKLTEGTLVVVPPSLIKRCKNHFHQLCGVSLILGNNGFVWICPTIEDVQKQDQLRYQVPSAPGTSSVETAVHVVSKDERSTMARIRNCIHALVHHKIQLFQTTIQRAYDASTEYDVKDIVKPDIMKLIVVPARHIFDEQ